MEKYYHYVEIGTSNFRTLVGAQPAEQHGLSVEPMPFFVRDLRERYASSHPHSKLVNAAVLPKASTAHVVSAFYVHPENVTAWKLPIVFLGMSRMGAPHPSVTEILEQRQLMHLLQNRPVRAMSVQRLLDLYDACRSLENFPLAFATRERARKLLKSLAMVGYYESGRQFDEVAGIPGGQETYSIRLVYARQQDKRQGVASLMWSAPAVPKIVHMLLPCFFTRPVHCGFDGESEAQRLRWRKALPSDWHVELWTPYRLTVALHDQEPLHWPTLLGVVPKFDRHKMPHYAAKYHLLAYFGGIFVDWQLHPGMVQQLLAAHQSSRQEGFWCLDPGPSALRSDSGAVLVARAFHPTMQLMGYEMPKHGIRREDAQKSLSQAELYLLKLYYQIWSGDELTCHRANLTRRKSGV
ncbi:unnamed protein product [Cladocopium goreaui]|uniref:Methyltransferase FkbM domain-containing protein n=1 Tax=Cladocopium goreaui TaxID=2562237 RepID=A0A9P1CQK8_9DINO|nr:unnamed protein product [Cladocopium goreaui]